MQLMRNWFQAFVFSQMRLVRLRLGAPGAREGHCGGVGGEVPEGDGRRLGAGRPHDVRGHPQRVRDSEDDGPPGGGLYTLNVTKFTRTCHQVEALEERQASLALSRFEPHP
jgi:hypothetical protein